MSKPDPIFDYCEQCGTEIYYGDDFYNIPNGGSFQHFCSDCNRKFKTVAELENYVDPWDEYDGGYER